MININNFKIIAHRGLTNGLSNGNENSPEKIIFNKLNYPSLINEIDIHIMDNGLFLGHNDPIYNVSLDFLIANKKYLILHVKHIQTNSLKAINTFHMLYDECHLFAHEEDKFCITNKGWIWSHPNQGLRANTILVMPEKLNTLETIILEDGFKYLRGICTDYPIKMLDLLNSNMPKDHV